MPIGTLRASRPPRDMKRQFLVCVFSSMLMLGLSACGQNPSPATSSNPLADPRNLATSAAADGRFSVDAPPSLRGEENKPKGPFGDVKPIEIQQGGSLGSLGLNLDTYFAGNVGDTNARIDRLEGAVTAMHRDLKILAPSMQRLALIETDLQDLVEQLEAVLQEEGSAAAPTAYVPPPQALSASEPSAGEEEFAEDTEPAPAVPAQQQKAPAAHQPAPVPTPTPAPAPTPAAAPVSAALQPGALQASGLRLGEHPGKTRIVIDMSGTPAYKHDLDNAEKIFMIELPNTAWAGPATQSFSSPLIQSYTAQPMDNNGGTRIVLVLKKSASVSYQDTLKPASDSPYHRLVIDLTAP